MHVNASAAGNNRHLRCVAVDDMLTELLAACARRERVRGQELIQKLMGSLEGSSRGCRLGKTLANEGGHSWTASAVADKASHEIFSEFYQGCCRHR